MAIYRLIKRRNGTFDVRAELKQGKVVRYRLIKYQVPSEALAAKVGAMGATVDAARVALKVSEVGASEPEVMETWPQ